MDLKTFLENFDTIAEAPNGIPKLRSLILDLAVRGKLVPQNPEDEPARKILEQIQEVKKTKKISEKKVEKLEEPDAWELPIGWAWTCLQELGEINPKNNLLDEMEVGFVPMPLVPTDYRQSVGYEKRRWSEIKKGFTHFANGDVGVAKITPCFQNRKSVVFSNLPNGYGSGTTELLIFRSLSELIDTKYVLLFLKTPHFIEEGISRMTGTAGQQRVPREYFAGCALPLPPLAEQKRIVTKVDELMALCDRLSSAQQTRDNLRQKLRKSAIDSLMNADDEALEKGWAIVRDNWHTLSQSPEDVGDLRRSVLQLAARGKLTVQNPEDESASQLLQKAIQEKALMSQVGLIAKPKQLSPIDKDECPFSLPSSWTWVRLEDICAYVVDCLHRTPKYQNEGYPAIRTSEMQPGRILFDQARKVGREEYELQTQRLVPKAGDVFYTREGSFGIAAVVPEGIEMCLSQRMMQFRLVSELNPHFFSWVMNSSVMYRQAARDVVGMTVPHVNIRSLKEFIFPLAPYAEQNRIVAKVDELMKMCDRLEESLRQSQQQAEALAASAISHLTI